MKACDLLDRHGVKVQFVLGRGQYARPNLDHHPAVRRGVS